MRLKAAGYTTAHIGKYLNGYGGGASCGPGDPYVPAGWDYWAAKMAATQGTCSENNYYQYSLFENGPGHPASGETVDYGSATTDYQTDVYRDHALQVLDRRPPSPNPALHGGRLRRPARPFEPAPRHKFTLSSVPLAPLPGFDEQNIDDKPLWLRLKARHKLTSSEKSNINQRRHRRLEMLLGVDEAIQAIVNKVAASGELDNTYFVFTSDNGFFHGEHRIGSGKYLPYEPSSHVPMLIRGPGIPPGIDLRAGLQRRLHADRARHGRRHRLRERTRRRPLDAALRPQPGHAQRPARSCSRATSAPASAPARSRPRA